MKKNLWLGLVIIGIACSIGAVVVRNAGRAGATGTPEAAIYVGGASVTTVPCGSAYTLSVSNYSGSAVWLEEIKNGKSNYSGSYPMPGGGTFVCNQDEGTYTINVYALVSGQKGDLISSLFLTVGPQGTACQVCNPAYCGGACVPGFETQLGCEPEQGYTLPYCAPPTNATGTASGYYNQNGQPFDPAKNIDWYYKDTSGNWWGCAAVPGGGSGCTEFAVANLYSWMTAAGLGNGNQTNIYIDPCMVKRLFPTDQAISELATLEGVAASSINLDSVCSGTPGYCDLYSSDPACPAGSGSRVPTTADVNNLFAAYNYYAPIGRQLKVADPNFEWASLDYATAILNNDGTVTFTYNSTYNPLTTWSFFSFQQVSCNIIVQTANAASDHSHDSVCNALYFTGLGEHYACSGTSCVASSTGSFTDSTCDNSCSVGTQHYACSSTSCVASSTGPYTVSGCNNACSCGPTDRCSTVYKYCYAKGITYDASCNVTGSTYAYDGSCTTGTVTGKCVQHYACSGTSCVEDDVNGTYTASDCNNACSSGGGGTPTATSSTACVAAIQQAAAQVTNLEAELKPLTQTGADSPSLQAARTLLATVITLISNTISEFCGVSINLSNGS